MTGTCSSKHKDSSDPRWSAWLWLTDRWCSPFSSSNTWSLCAWLPNWMKHCSTRTESWAYAIWRTERRVRGNDSQAFRFPFFLEVINLGAMLEQNLQFYNFNFTSCPIADVCSDLNLTPRSQLMILILKWHSNWNDIYADKRSYSV